MLSYYKKFNQRQKKVKSVNEIYKYTTIKRKSLMALGVVLIIIIITTFTFVLLKSALFNIDQINITGTSSIISKNIEDEIQKQLTIPKFFIFKNQNIFLFNSSAIQPKLITAYNLENVIISKHLPNKLYVKITERVPVAIVFTTDKMHEFDKYGYIIKTTNTTPEIITQQTNTLRKTIPIIYNLQSDLKYNTPQDILGLNLLNIILYIKSNLEKQKIYPLAFKLHQEKQSPKITIELENQIELYFDYTEDIDTQLNKLHFFLKENDITKLQYINLRFKNRVYSKPK